LSSKEVERLQSLGRQVREIAELDIQERTAIFGAPSMTGK
jgi:hypothetical protein